MKHSAIKNRNTNPHRTRTILIRLFSIVAFLALAYSSFNAPTQLDPDDVIEDKVLRPYTAQEIRKHDSPRDCWTVIGNAVYDMTFWQRRHPGGSDAIIDHAGYNMTRGFEMVPHSDWAKEMKESYIIGYATEPVPEAPFMNDDESFDEEEDELGDEVGSHNHLVENVAFRNAQVRVDDLDWWKKVLGTGGANAPSTWKVDDPCFGPPDLIVPNTVTANSQIESETSDYVFERFLVMKSTSPKDYERPYSQELGKRLIVDHRMMSPVDIATTPSNLFYIRTGIPLPLESQLASQQSKESELKWDVSFVGMNGDGHSVRNMSIVEINEMGNLNDQGKTVMECSGNTRRWRFGLISQGHWTAGVTIVELLLRQMEKETGGASNLREALLAINCKESCSHVLVEGYDRHTRAVGGRRGASWIFSIDQVIDTGMFLATELNGAPLSLDHGYPVRLVVPRWYGCTSIKWVTKIQFVNGANMPPTTQMLEFRTRVHMPNNPRTMSSAADWSAQMGLSATATRIEVWRSSSNPRKILHKVVGMLWGDETPRTRNKQTQQANDGTHITPLFIRLKGGGPKVPVMFVNPRNANRNEWVQWCHVFNPLKQGGIVGGRDIQSELKSLAAGGDFPVRQVKRSTKTLYRVEISAGTSHMYAPRLRKGRWGSNWYSARFDLQ